MAHARPDTSRALFLQFLDDPSQQTCMLALSGLEADLRSLALLGLADWERVEVVAPELFAALGALQRPSWGSWNFLLQSLRTARRAQSRAMPDARPRIEGARTLQAITDYLDARAPADLVDAARPLSTYLGGRASLRRTEDVLVLPIAVRNQIAHFPPGEAGWPAILDALRPLVEWNANHRCELLLENRAWPSPWFLEDDATLWAFNGVEKDLSVVYAAAGSSRPRTAPDQAATFARAIQRLFGKADLQAASFQRLLAKLAPEEVRGVILGDFLVGRPVAEGGFASVHIGRQLSTTRKVAVKILRDGLTDEDRQRFEQEAVFLSRIEARAVVGVISHGEDAWSVPRSVDLSGEAWFQELSRGSQIKTYLALEWVEGETLEACFRRVYVDRTSERPALGVLRGWFRDAAEALAEVHAQGLLHRDIKPSNLMVTRDGEIRVMDFGIARRHEGERTIMTSTGSTLGTPPYMAPEQLRSTSEAGVPADVYALTATFYELFTGHRLYGHDLDPPDLVTTRKLRGDLPTRPRVLMNDIPWELETILLGGLQAEVADRYQRTDAIVRDLQHWERNEPIEYRRPGPIRRAQLAYRRHRTTAHLAFAFLFVVVLGAWLVLRQLSSAEDRVVAEQESAASDRALALAEQGRAEWLAGRAPQAAVYLSKAYSQGVGDESTLYLLANAMRPIDAAALTFPSGRGVANESISFRTKRLVTLHQHTATLRDLDSGQEVASLEHPGYVYSATFSPDGALVVSVAEDAARLWRSDTGALVTELVGHANKVAAAAFDPESQRLVTAGYDDIAAIWGRDGNLYRRISAGPGLRSAEFVAKGRQLMTIGDHDVRLWTVQTGVAVGAPMPHTGSVTSARVSSNGSRVLTTSTQGMDGAVVASLWNATGELVTVLGGTVSTAALADDGSRIVTGSPDGSATLWNGETGKVIEQLLGHTQPIRGVAFDPDSTRVITCGEDGSARVWDAGSGMPLAVLNGHTKPINTAVFGATGLIVTASDDRTARVWESASGTSLATYSGHGDAVVSAGFSPDGRRVVSYDADTVQVWEVATPLLASLHQDDTTLLPMFRPTFSPDGQEFLAIHGGNVADPAKRWHLAIYDATTGALKRELVDLPDEILAGAFSVDGAIAAGGSDHLARIWRPGMASPLVLKGHEEPVLSLAFSPDGRHVVTGSLDETAIIWDAITGRPFQQLVGPSGGIHTVVFTPDSTAVLTAAADGAAVLWDVATGLVIHPLPHLGPPPVKGATTTIAMSPGGDRALTSVVLDPHVKVWALQAGELLFEVTHPETVAASFSTDRRIVTGAFDGTTNIWGPAGELITSLDVQAGSVSSVGFSPDGGRVVTGGTEGLVLSDATTGKALTIFLDGAAHGRVDVASFNRDGTRLLSASKDGWVRLWDVHVEMRESATIAEIVGRPGGEPSPGSP